MPLQGPGIWASVTTLAGVRGACCCRSSRTRCCASPSRSLRTRPRSGAAMLSRGHPGQAGCAYVAARRLPRPSGLYSPYVCGEARAAPHIQYVQSFRHVHWARRPVRTPRTRRRSRPSRPREANDGRTRTGPYGSPAPCFPLHVRSLSRSSERGAQLLRLLPLQVHHKETEDWTHPECAVPPSGRGYGTWRGANIATRLAPGAEGATVRFSTGVVVVEAVRPGSHRPRRRAWSSDSPPHR